MSLIPVTYQCASRRTLLASGSAMLLGLCSGCAAREYVPHSLSSDPPPTLTLTPRVADVVRRPPTGEVDDLTLAEMGFTLTLNWDNIADTPYPLRPDLTLDGRISAPDAAATEFETLTQITESTFSHTLTTAAGEREFDVQTLTSDVVSLLQNHSRLTADTFAPAPNEHKRTRTVELRLTGDIGGDTITVDEKRVESEVTIERDATTL